MQPSLRVRLLTALGAKPSAVIEAAQGFAGGLNAGIWFVKGCGEDTVLKLVKFDPRTPSELVEADTLVRLRRDHPAITSDASVSFPYKILHIIGTGGVRRYDLIAMQRAPGQALALTIADKWYSNREDELMRIFERVGACLSQFHKRYGGKQHGDYHPQNIFYDDVTGAITCIDLGGMGGITDCSDRERLAKSVVQLAACYGPKLEEAIRYFERGYAQAAGTSSRLGGA